jgi:hypothetical protein
MLRVRRLPSGIVRQAARIGSELLGDLVGDDLGHLGGSGEKRTEKPHCAQLYREPEPVVIAAASVDQRAVSLVEVKEPLKLRDRRRLGVAAVGRERWLGLRKSIGTAPSAPRARGARSRLAVSLHRRTAIRSDRRGRARRPGWMLRRAMSL